MNQNFNWDAEWKKPTGGEAVTAASFEGKNEIFNNYGVAVGDVIAFPPVEMLDKMRFTQKSKSLGTDVSLLRVYRNDKPSYLAVGCLSTTDANREPVDEFRREMLNYQDAEARIQYLCKKGAVIKGVRKEKKAMTAFKDRKPNGSEEREVTIIEYAG